VSSEVGLMSHIFLHLHICISPCTFSHRPQPPIIYLHNRSAVEN